MGHQLGLVVIALTLVACAEGRRPEVTAANPHHVCRQQGIAFATEAFADCVDGVIAERCTAAGHAPETEAYAACVQDYRRTVFVAQQLEIRGYRLFNETN